MVNAENQPIFRKQPLAWIRHKWRRKSAPPRRTLFHYPQEDRYIHTEYADAPPDWNESSINPQDGSMLMNLPWELRSYIFKLVLGGHKIHMSDATVHPVSLRLRRIQFHRCRWQKEEDDRCPFDCNGEPSVQGWYAKEDFAPCKSAALLRTCRAVYREGITILYAENSFSITDNTSLVELQRLFQPRRVHFITKLEVAFIGWRRARLRIVGPNRDTTEAHSVVIEENRPAWELVGAMQGLKTLCVTIKLPPMVWDFNYRTGTILREPVTERNVLRGVKLFVDEICASVPASVKTDIYSQHDYRSKAPSFLWGPHRVHGIEKQNFLGSPGELSDDYIVSEID